MAMRKIKFLPDHYYHVYNRGTEQRVIFLDDADYRRFATTMGEYRHGLVVVAAYVLMPNHFHLLIRPHSDDSLSRYMHRLSTSFTMYFNARYERSGNLFQGRFKAVVMESSEQLLHVSRYIHGNPVKGTLEQTLLDRMRTLERYPWSSYPDYVGSRAHGVVEKEYLISSFLGVCTEKAEDNKKVKAEPRFESKYREFMRQWLEEIVKAEPR